MSGKIVTGTWTADGSLSAKIEPEPGVAEAERQQVYEKIVLEGLDFVTDRLSTQVRTIALACIATFWSLMTGEVTHAPLVDKQCISVVAIFAVLALVFDACQYLAGLSAGKRAIRRLGAGPVAFPYDDDWASWKCREIFFAFKLICAIIAAVLLVVAIAVDVTVSPGGR